MVQNTFQSKLFLYCFVLFFILVSGCTGSEKDMEERSIPIIYFSDLFHPHDDPDDHFDLLALYSLKEFDIKAIILDQGEKQDQRSGSIPIQQLNELTGRNVPWGKGLARKLRSLQDDGIDQPPAYQEGVALVLKSLKEAKSKVTLISVGSLRDMAAAFLREPDLFREKVSRLYCFIGEARLQSFQEYNVALDPIAFSIIMNSGLPVYWVPCFDGGLWKNGGNSSYWQTVQEKLLTGTSPIVMNFFRYALLYPEKKVLLSDFDSLVSPEDQKLLFHPLRNLWCTSVFTHAAGRTITKVGNRWESGQDAGGKSEKNTQIFEFRPTAVWVDTDGTVYYENSERSHQVHRFHVLDNKNYSRAMTSITNSLYRNFK